MPSARFHITQARNWISRIMKEETIDPQKLNAAIEELEKAKRSNWVEKHPEVSSLAIVPKIIR